MTTISQNFAFLSTHDPIFLQLAASAERNFALDPNTTLVKVRQLGEALAQDIATRTNVAFEPATKQVDLINLLHKEGIFGKTTTDAFHFIRKVGNDATHTFTSDSDTALKVLKMIHGLLATYHSTFDKDFVAPEFITPTYHDELAELKAQNQSQEALLKEQQAKFDARIHKLQEALKHNKAPKTSLTLAEFIPNEEMTRLLIDETLRSAGWLADSQKLTYANGERPEKGKNKAIAEWQIGRQKADYVLFIGLMPVAVVEAKKQNTDVSGKIAQAERYALSFTLDDEMTPAWQYQNERLTQNPWTSSQGEFTIPFVYSTNGRPYLAQLAEQSGTWFRDVRKPSNIKKALQSFHSPQGLLQQLAQNLDKSTLALQQEPMAYLGLRDYQQKAIHAVEHALTQGQKHILLAMATGTGKTRTIIGLIYRLLKAQRFHRILFLVDRTSLGKQAYDSMDEMTLEQNLPLSKIYNINELGDMAIHAATRVQVATVQAMIKRMDSDTPPSIDAFDCIIVDEAHRGYTLDSEMNESELDFRENSFYVSKYRSVLDYFDAIRIGLTATPAKHTVDIFGKPVFNYTYREAVADDWLIDYEPPIRFVTELAQNGIHLPKGDTVPTIDTATGKVDTLTLEDEMKFELSAFNRRVITEDFNRVICQALSSEIEPDSDEKTLIFCATDRHADMVKRLLDTEFSELYGDDYHEEAVRKITGQSDKVDDLIRKFKNERYPSIAVTVDLLTTGIDVPAICNLVFLRRVKSRILYEQMKGRATRRCDDIGKTTFRIYDAVDLYADMQSVDTMKPLAKRPNISLETLTQEILNLPTADDLACLESNDEIGDKITGMDSSIAQDTSLTTAQELSKHQAQLVSEFSQKLMQVLRRASAKAEQKPKLKAKLDALHQKWQIAPDKLHKHLSDKGFEHIKTFIQTTPTLLADLAKVGVLAGSERMPIIYTGFDTLISRTQHHDENHTKLNDDYLADFEAFIKTELNKSTSLSVVATKPKELNRQTLADIKKLLDEHGYTDKKLNTAWKNAKSEDITANIVAHIRRVALGEPLIPFEERVNKALSKILSSHTWTPIQQKALERIAKQLKHEVVIDRQFVRERFADKGGDKVMDKQLSNRLDEVLEMFNEYLWVV